MLPATLLLLVATAIVIVWRTGGRMPEAVASHGASPRRSPIGMAVRRMAMRITLHQPVPQAGDRALPDGRAAVPGPLPRPARADLRQGDRRGELHRLPPVRVHLPAGRDQGRDAQGGEAQLREDLHPRALRLRVLRAVRAGLPDRRDHHDEVVRHVRPPIGARCCSTRIGCTPSACSTSRRGPRATCFATCRRRPRKTARSRKRHAGSRQAAHA